MSEQTSYGKLLERLISVKPYVGKTIAHRETGNVYVIVDFAFREADMSLEFLYSPIFEVGIIFSRPISELTDGWFATPFDPVEFRRHYAERLHTREDQDGTSVSLGY